MKGGWYAYDFRTPRFPDYPKYSAWPDAYYVTTNEADRPPKAPSPTVYALDRSAMLKESRPRPSFARSSPFPAWASRP